MGRSELDLFAKQKISVPAFVLRQFLAYYQNWRHACRSIELFESRQEQTRTIDEAILNAFAGRKKFH